ncbi:Similar to hypothetical protein GLRG_07112 [Glomerella graminicola M1.001]; acc. no. EFQ31968 [Pyronema omphalodes CBS 100304]|uniref:Uncharacterized protein n=1 Tax=Pyronema omphalodes (strain CBS 100304) TaxID=1076935 RepID=U4L0R7_PYROM|nr:Similar to hypothetical protein GLRG_07112 [Glomerella graminicola M1.001]; acc. no. EFQ31968 [Pyronema omphalodes CBS 100304]
MSSPRRSPGRRPPSHLTSPAPHTPPILDPLELQSNPLQQLYNASLRLQSDLQGILDTQSAAFTPGSGISLPSTRTNLLTAMRSLSSLKGSESRLCSTLSQNLTAKITSTRAQTAKSERLRDELRKIRDSPEGVHATAIKEEEIRVATEIKALKRKLKELEKRQRILKKESKEAESRVQAKEASYKGALESVSASLAGLVTAGDPEVMVRGWEEERRRMEEQREGARRERAALKEGIKLWERAAEVVEGFEVELGRRVREKNMVGVLTAMGGVVRELEDMVEKAQTEGWNLLVAAIGAELQAMKEAREVLRKRLPKERSPIRSPIGSGFLGESVAGAAGNNNGLSSDGSHSHQGSGGLREGSTGRSQEFQGDGQRGSGLLGDGQRSSGFLGDGQRSSGFLGDGQRTGGFLGERQRTSGFLGDGQRTSGFLADGQRSGLRGDGDRSSGFGGDGERSGEGRGDGDRSSGFRGDGDRSGGGRGDGERSGGYLGDAERNGGLLADGGSSNEFLGGVQRSSGFSIDEHRNGGDFFIDQGERRSTEFLTARDEERRRNDYSPLDD